MENKIPNKKFVFLLVTPVIAELSEDKNNYTLSFDKNVFEGKKFYFTGKPGLAVVTSLKKINFPSKELK